VPALAVGLLHSDMRELLDHYNLLLIANFPSEPSQHEQLVSDP
jgi:hypothetical protein